MRSSLHWTAAALEGQFRSFLYCQYISAGKCAFQKLLGFLLLMLFFAVKTWTSLESVIPLDVKMGFKRLIYNAISEGAGFR